MQKLGIREICDVVLKAKHTQKIGNKVFYKNEPVMYFDTLKTSTLEGQAATVYADGGKGNPHLVAWEGERQLTFTMEDALISPEGLMILTGAGLIEATEGKPVYQHVVEQTDLFTVKDGVATIYVKEKPYLPEDLKDNVAYVMVENAKGQMSEPFIPNHNADWDNAEPVSDENSPYLGYYEIIVDGHDNYFKDVRIEEEVDYTIDTEGKKLLENADYVIVDYYTVHTSGAHQIEITPDKFAGNYYLEASTLFRNTDGVDLAAEFVIPNCKIQSNFSFNMAASGDPSTFTFTMDAFPDYPRFDRSKKVLCLIQIIDPESDHPHYRTQTNHDTAHDYHI